MSFTSSSLSIFLLLQCFLRAQECDLCLLCISPGGSLLTPMALFQWWSCLHGSRAASAGPGDIAGTGDMQSAAELQALPATPTAPWLWTSWLFSTRDGRSRGARPPGLGALDCRSPAWAALQTSCCLLFSSVWLFWALPTLVCGVFLFKIKSDLLFLLRIINKKLKH